MLINRCILVIAGAALATSFSPASNSPTRPSHLLLQKGENAQSDDENFTQSRRRSLFSSIFLGGFALSTSSGRAFADAGDEDESFASIAARASVLSRDTGDRTATTITTTSDDPRTAYDFSLPVEGVDVPFKDIVRQEYDEEGRARVRVLLVVNMKEDDPIARKDIPEFISLAAKYVRRYRQ
jgi:hypothetical protein